MTSFQHHPGTPAIRFDSVRKSYGQFEALKGVSLSVEPGDFFGLLGPNGAGKTTLIGITAGLTRATAGSVSIMGHDVQRDFRAARRALGVVPQELVFDPFFTVRETLRWQSGYFGLKKNDDWIDELLANLDLTNKADSNMRSLSGGMKRRVLVGQALVHRPPVILLDEPTAGVDVELRQSLWKFIRRLNHEGHTIVLTTHYLEEAQQLCNRIAMLKQGEVVKLDETRNLLRNFSGARVALRLKQNDQALPESIMPWLSQRTPSGLLEFKLPGYEQIETLLGQLRLAGCGVDELEIKQVDLEDVFLQTMQSKQPIVQENRQ